MFTNDGIFVKMSAGAGKIIYDMFKTCTCEMTQQVVPNNVFLATSARSRHVSILQQWTNTVLLGTW